MTRRDTLLLRASLVAVWLVSALVSALGAQHASAARVAEAGIASPALAALSIWGGVAVDAGLGLAMWWRPSRRVYALALASTIAMTLLASACAPAWWLDPLGALLKNLPILAALDILRRNAS